MKRKSFPSMCRWQSFLNFFFFLSIIRATFFFEQHLLVFGRRILVVWILLSSYSSGEHRLGSLTPYRPAMKDGAGENWRSMHIFAGRSFLEQLLASERKLRSLLE